MGGISYRSDLSTDEKLLMAVVRAAETFKRVVSVIYRKQALSFPQYNVLRVLDASKDGQCRITDVSRIMLVPGANMTGIAKRLEKNGFIVRKSDPLDERVTILELTPRGKTTLINIEKVLDKHTHAMLKGFPAQEKRELLDKVKRLIKNSREIA
ncbi:MAG: MarR family winged helix-turn-helix transcriptional regulator [Syntrophorhabdaceae bacterium]|nr:MarR family winged helix-turn-helix transcriptional regulator [Syntrophorhabdaceae bacterium]